MTARQLIQDIVNNTDDLDQPVTFEVEKDSDLYNTQLKVESIILNSEGDLAMKFKEV